MENGNVTQTTIVMGLSATPAATVTQKKRFKNLLVLFSQF